MFTSEPSLAQRIERMIGDTPIVDPHTHIRCDQPSAPDLAALMSYHWVRTELIAVGMPAEDLDPAPPARRAGPPLDPLPQADAKHRDGLVPVPDLPRPLRLRRAQPDRGQLPRSSSTRSRRPGKIPTGPGPSSRIVATSGPSSPASGNRSADPSKNPDYFYYMLDAHYLFCPGVATDLDPFFVGPDHEGRILRGPRKRPRRTADDHRDASNA